MNEKLAGYHVVVEIPIAWGEMDSMNHVNGVVYFRYIETSRFEYFAKMGFLDERTRFGIGPILAAVQCTYKVPLTHPDTISVGVRVSRLESARFTMQHVIYSHKLQRVAAEGESVVVSYDYRQARKVPLPQEMIDRIKEIDSIEMST